MVATGRLGGDRVWYHLHLHVCIHVCDRQLPGLRSFGIDLRGTGQICSSWWNVSLRGTDLVSVHG